MRSPFSSALPFLGLILLVTGGTAESQEMSFSGHRSAIRSVACSADGRMIASASLDKTVRVWQTDQSNAMRVLGEFPGAVLSVALGTEGHLLVLGCADNTIRVCTCTDGAVLRTIVTTSGPVHSVAISPDGHYVASSGNDGSVRIWQIGDGTLVRTFAGHAAPVWSVAFSPDGRYLLSASSDHKVGVWNVADGALIRTLDGHTAPVLLMDADGALPSGGVDRRSGEHVHRCAGTHDERPQRDSLRSCRQSQRNLCCFQRRGRNGASLGHFVRTRATNILERHCDPRHNVYR